MAEGREVGVVRPRLLFLATEYYFFNALKKEITAGPLEQGFDIYVAARCDDAVPGEKRDGVTVIPLQWRRSPSLLKSALQVLPELYRVRRAIKEVNPHILHNLALKPSVYGSIAAFGQNLKVVHSLTGVGFLFVAKSAPARLARAICLRILKLSVSLYGALIVTLNKDDAAFLRERLRAEKNPVRSVHGSGFDPHYFHLQPEPPDSTFRFLLVSRLLYMKGIQVAVEAYDLLRRRGVHAELVVCGIPDPENPSSIPESVIQSWSQIPGITFLRSVRDVRPEIGKSHVMLQTALGGEGLPRAIVEAAASGRPIIASNINGNRDVISSGETGLLVPPGDAEALADAMQWTMTHTDDLRRWAAAARAKVLLEFTSERVAESYTEIYRELDSTE